MKSKGLIIISFLCVISIIGCIVVNGETNPNVTPQNHEIPQTTTVVKKIPNTNLAEKFTWTLNNGEKVDLTYSHVESGIFIDRYKFVDKDNNKFSFDNEGDIVSFLADDSWMFEVDLYDFVKNPLDDSEWISESKAESIAQMHGKTFYGDVFDTYKLINIEKTGGYCYSLSFKNLMGKDDCITASYAYVDIKYDGDILMSAIHQHKVAASVDEEKLAEIDMNLINAVVEANAIAIYRENFRGFEAQGVTLILDGENFALEISTHIDFYDSDLDMIGGTLENFYYSIK